MFLAACGAEGGATTKEKVVDDRCYLLLESDEKPPLDSDLPTTVEGWPAGTG
jgi:hypothetical protein